MPPLAPAVGASGALLASDYASSITATVANMSSGQLVDHKGFADVPDSTHPKELKTLPEQTSRAGGRGCLVRKAIANAARFPGAEKGAVEIRPVLVLRELPPTTARNLTAMSILSTSVRLGSRNFNLVKLVEELRRKEINS